VSVSVVSELLVRELAAELVDQRHRQRALVRVDPDRDHNDLLLLLLLGGQYDPAERRASTRRAAKLL